MRCASQTRSARSLPFRPKQQQFPYVRMLALSHPDLACHLRDLSTVMVKKIETHKDYQHPKDLEHQPSITRHGRIVFQQLSLSTSDIPTRSAIGPWARSSLRADKKSRSGAVTASMPISREAWIAIMTCSPTARPVGHLAQGPVYRQARHDPLISLWSTIRFQLVSRLLGRRLGLL